MATEKQIESNRINAQKSTGPRTESGKSRSSLNALKHGFSAQTIILPGEDGQHFQQFHADFAKDLAPVGALEISMVQELAHTQWSIARIRAHEANLFALGHENHADTIHTDGDETIQAAFAGAIIFKAERPTLKDIGLYLQRHNRMFLNTLKALREIQAARKSEERAEFDLAVNYAYVHQQEQTPFIPTEFGFLCTPEEIAPHLRRETYRIAHLPSKHRPEKPAIHITHAA